MIKGFTGAKPRFVNTDRVSMFKDGTGHSVKLGDTIYINGHQMIVRYGKHCDDSTNWLFPDERGRMMYGWYAESPDGNWEVNLYKKKDQIVSTHQWIAQQLINAKQDEVMYI